MIKRYKKKKKQGGRPVERKNNNEEKVKTASKEKVFQEAKRYEKRIK